MAFLYTAIFGDRLLKEPLKTFPVSKPDVLVQCDVYVAANFQMAKFASPIHFLKIIFWK